MKTVLRNRAALRENERATLVIDTPTNAPRSGAVTYAHDSGAQEFIRDQRNISYIQKYPLASETVSGRPTSQGRAVTALLSTMLFAVNTNSIATIRSTRPTARQTATWGSPR